MRSGLYEMFEIPYMSINRAKRRWGTHQLPPIGKAGLEISGPLCVCSQAIASGIVTVTQRPVDITARPEKYMKDYIYVR